MQGKIMSRHLRSETRSRSRHQGNQGMPIADSHTALSACGEAPVTLESAVSAAHLSPLPGVSTGNGNWCPSSLRRTPGVVRANTGARGDLELRRHALLHTRPSSTTSPEPGFMPKVRGTQLMGTGGGHAPPQGLSSCRTHRLRRNRALILCQEHTEYSQVSQRHTSCKSRSEPSMSGNRSY